VLVERPVYRAALRSGVDAPERLGELDPISFAAALELTILITGKEPGRLPRVAVRWLERYVQECEPTLANVMLAVSALSALADSSRRRLSASRMR
jgi:hypothetical protein